MWTKDELIEIRDRAEIEAENPRQNILWRNACVALASGASNLISLTDRICNREITALADENGYIKPPQATEE